MTRERHIKWMRVALAIAEHSRCHRTKYGTVVLDAQGRVVATGHNGKPADALNDHICYREDLPPDAPKAKCCLHSEQNALVFGNYHEYQGGTIYVTGMPCEDCALLIAQARITTLVCLEDPRGYPGLQVLADYGFRLDQITIGTPKRPIQVIVLSRAEVEG